MSTDDVLTPDAIEFLHMLQRALGSGRAEILAAREAHAQRLRDGELPDFLEETRHVRASDSIFRRALPAVFIEYSSSLAWTAAMTTYWTEVFRLLSVPVTRIRSFTSSGPRASNGPEPLFVPLRVTE